MRRSQFQALSRTVVSRLSRRAALPRLGASVLLAVGAGRASAAAAMQATPTTGSGRAGYLVVRRYNLKPDADYAELTRRVNEGFVPIIRDVPGFVEYLFVEPGDGTHLAVSIFTDQAGADESTARATGWSEANVTEFVELPAFSVVGGPVRLDVTAP